MRKNRRGQNELRHALRNRSDATSLASSWKASRRCERIGKDASRCARIGFVAGADEDVGIKGGHATPLAWAEAPLRRTACVQCRPAAARARSRGLRALSIGSTIRRTRCWSRRPNSRVGLRTPSLYTASVLCVMTKLISKVRDKRLPAPETAQRRRANTVSGDVDRLANFKIQKAGTPEVVLQILRQAPLAAGQSRGG